MSKKKPIYCHGFLFCLLLTFMLAGCGGGGSANGVGGGDIVNGNNSATLSWDPPMTNVDGTSLIDLVGYKVYYGTSSQNYTEIIDVANVSTYTIGDLAPGTYYFAVTAYDTEGNESDYSEEVSKTIQ